MGGDDHFIRPDNNCEGSATEGLSPDLKDIVRRLLAGPLSGDPLFEEAAGVICRLHFDLRFVRGCSEIDRRNLRHWREECGKLHAQVATAKDQRNQFQSKAQRAERSIVDLLQAHEMEKKVLYEALERALSHFEAMSGEQATRAAGELEEILTAQTSATKHTDWHTHIQNDQVTISLDHYNGLIRDHQRLTALEAPDDGSCIRCGAVPRNASGLCATCLDEDAARAVEIDPEECGNYSAGSPPR